MADIITLLTELLPTAISSSVLNRATSPLPSSTTLPSSPPSVLPVYRCIPLAKRFLYHSTLKHGGRIAGTPDWKRI